MVFKKIIFQNRYVALETPSRSPPLHGKNHLKFPFWLLEPFPYLFTCLERRFHQNYFTHQVYSNIDQAVRTLTWNRELEFFASRRNFFLNVVILTTCNSTHLLNKFHIYCVNPCTGRNVGTHCFFPRTVKFKCFQLVSKHLHTFVAN